MGAPSESLDGMTALAPVWPRELDAAVAVQVDGPCMPVLIASQESGGLLYPLLQQEFEPPGGANQRIETESRGGTP